jgi:hypothetical protein
MNGRLSGSKSKAECFGEEKILFFYSEFEPRYLGFPAYENAVQKVLAQYALSPFKLM